MKKRSKAAYMISNVARTYDIHPQTLRLYERHGLMTPSRSEGNTRLYTDEDLERLELILNLTRDLGVNLAGVEIILNMRAKMEEMQKEIKGFMEYVQQEFASQSPQFQARKENALVRTMPLNIVRINRKLS
jgi:MerR family transcriptional regulator/heat shock protein HspR